MGLESERWSVGLGAEHGSWELSVGLELSTRGSERELSVGLERSSLIRGVWFCVWVCPWVWFCVWRVRGVSVGLVMGTGVGTKTQDPGSVA